MTDIVLSSTIKTYLGRIDYDDGLRAQHAALKALSDDETHAVILGLEHEPVITLGIRGRSATDLHVTPENLRLKGFQLRETARGGQATLHSPGQLVIYPCVNLRAFDLGARSFVELVQSTTETWFKNLGVAVTASTLEPGLFVGPAKIAAFGFKIAHGLTSHGLAINVANDLSHFDLIRTCGVAGQKVARLADFGVETDLEALFLSWTELFQSNLESIRS